ncbi:hypothetical protein BAUCODRAFT_39718 [Baudoinia panamericana UAMH 10762]|uniref:Uncharacterized protein n=1 Tax=Baudoinia panamericana (strain UAMH 10762) TaxID=717646 RepID=M2LAS1_BAUPA|nr:uncharacterized protein BAUCODRAFT_39718 [Baudoinia panamericana UAMH 10762]EMC90912.1 hypothetical protein BAUCODRAFT_39718 [Baudoinia panamericana UAMH 10762]
MVTQHDRGTSADMLCHPFTALATQLQSGDRPDCPKYQDEAQSNFSPSRGSIIPQVLAVLGVCLPTSFIMTSKPTITTSHDADALTRFKARHTAIEAMQDHSRRMLQELSLGRGRYEDYGGASGDSVGGNAGDIKANSVLREPRRLSGLSEDHDNGPVNSSWGGWRVLGGSREPTPAAKPSGQLTDATEVGQQFHEKNEAQHIASPQSETKHGHFDGTDHHGAQLGRADAECAAAAQASSRSDSVRRQRFDRRLSHDYPIQRPPAIPPFQLTQPTTSAPPKMRGEPLLQRKEASENLTEEGNGQQP